LIFARASFDLAHALAGETKPFADLLDAFARRPSDSKRIRTIVSSRGLSSRSTESTR